MITIAVGVGENKNILEACDIFKTQKPNVNIELIENDKKLAKSISDKNIDATIRGSLAASNVLKQLKESYPKIEIDLQKEDEIKILEYTQSQRARTVKIGNVEIAGTKLRQVLGLRSTNFNIEVNGEKITFNVVGYGHGVGMSQTGADSLAKQGKSAEEIIKHFYTDIEIKTVNEI